MAPLANSWWTDLRIRLVGGSLLRRTVVSVAAFTMSTCLLLGLISMAAVGATRAVVGAEPPVDADVAAVEASDEALGETAPGKKSAPRSRSDKKSSARSSSKGAPSRGSRRAGGAVSPADALRGSGTGEDGS